MQSIPHHAGDGLLATAAEAEIVSRAAAGDEAAFEAIMRRHNQLLFRTARSIVNNDADAEDTVQDAYLRAWRALGGYRAESKLSTWLVRITVNEALGRLRRRGARAVPVEVVMASREPENRARLTEDPVRGPERSAARIQVRQLIEEHIDLLPEVFRTVFVLRAVEEMSVEEVAEALEIPEATVRTRFFPRA